MLKYMLTASAALLALPAAAQMTSPVEPETTTAEPATEAQTMPGDAQTAPARPATTDQVRSIVDQEFPTYDVDSSGDLDSAELGAWLGKLRAAAPTGEAAGDQAAWTAAAFKAADGDASGKVNKDELVTFLARASQPR